MSENINNSNTLASEIINAIDLGTLNRFFILPTRVHRAIASIIPAKIIIITLLRLQKRKIEVIRAVSVSQCENFKLF